MRALRDFAYKGAYDHESDCAGMCSLRQFVEIWLSSFLHINRVTQMEEQHKFRPVNSLFSSSLCGSGTSRVAKDVARWKYCKGRQSRVPTLTYPIS